MREDDYLNRPIACEFWGGKSILLRLAAGNASLESSDSQIGLSIRSWSKQTVDFRPYLEAERFREFQAEI